jgi:hypothetical protein
MKIMLLILCFCYSVNFVYSSTQEFIEINNNKEIENSNLNIIDKILELEVKNVDLNILFKNIKNSCSINSLSISFSYMDFTNENKYMLEFLNSINKLYHTCPK